MLDGTHVDSESTEDILPGMRVSEAVLWLPLGFPSQRVCGVRVLLENYKAEAESTKPNYHSEGSGIWSELSVPPFAQLLAASNLVCSRLIPLIF